jgi:hypothetical protein
MGPDSALTAVGHLVMAASRTDVETVDVIILGLGTILIAPGFLVSVLRSRPPLSKPGILNLIWLTFLSLCAVPAFLNTTQCTKCVEPNPRYLCCNDPEQYGFLAWFIVNAAMLFFLWKSRLAQRSRHADEGPGSD